MIKVLFVCLGNICRSPMAESMFRHKVSLVGLDNKIYTDSAATSNYEIGSPTHNGTKKVLIKNKIPCTSKNARKLKSKDLESFDYIIAMDEDNYKNINDLDNRISEKVYLLSQFVKNADWISVPDPWYTDNFDYTYELLDKGCDGLLNEIIEKLK